MRNLNECQAEVFRRSEKRIKQRRQRRNHVLMACISLVFLCAIVAVQPPVTPDGPVATEETNIAMGALTEDRQESFSCQNVSVEISGAGFSRSYTDPNQVQLISEQLLAYSVSNPKNNHPASESVQNETVRGSSDLSEVDNYDTEIRGQSGTVGYTVILDMGDTTEYYLAGNTLENRTTNQTYTLSKEQVKVLSDLLGIPSQ